MTRCGLAKVACHLQAWPDRGRGLWRASYDLASSSGASPWAVVCVLAVSKTKSRGTADNNASGNQLIDAAYRRWGAGASVRVFDIHAGPLRDLLEKKGPFDAQLVKLAAQPVQT